MSATTNHYDLIVLGADIAGLVAAALVARRGKRVLVLPHGSADGAYRLGSRTLALENNPIIHLGSPAVRRVVHELGLVQQVRREQTLLDGLVHFVLPDQRLDVEPGFTNFANEARREFDDAAVIDAFGLRDRWAEASDPVIEALLSSDNALVADGFWSRRFLARITEQLPSNAIDELEPLPSTHPGRTIARAIEPWMQDLSLAQLGKAASLRLARLWTNGPFDLPGGVRRLRELLLQRIELHSGEIKRELRVAEVLTRRGRVTGISLLGKRDRYGCDHLLIATAPGRLLDGALTVEQLPRPLVDTLQAIVPVAQRYVLHLEVEERGLSPALAGMVICAPAKTGPDSDFARHGIGSTYLRSYPTGESMRLLTVTHIAAHGAPLQHLREQIVDDLDARGVLPFVRPYVRWIHSPHDERELSDGTGSIRGIDPGSVMAAPMSCIYAIRGAPSLGMGVLPYASGIRNLHFASRLTLPGLGLEGEFAAGTMAAGIIAHGSKSPFGRVGLLNRA